MPWNGYGPTGGTEARVQRLGVDAFAVPSRLAEIRPASDARGSGAPSSEERQDAIRKGRSYTPGRRTFGRVTFR